jgi:phytoene dehydrogenase-like protein
MIAGTNCQQLDLQVYGFDPSLAPPGKGVIKVELFAKPSYFSRLYPDQAAYKDEKDRIANQVIALLEPQFPGLQEDIEVIDVSTLHTWERYMGGTQGHNNFPNKPFSPFRSVLGLDEVYTLPGLHNFYFTGQWATSAGALIMNALSGKTAIQTICKNNGRKFTTQARQQTVVGGQWTEGKKATP